MNELRVEYAKAKDRPWDIYAIINKNNNKVYIGQTTQPMKQPQEIACKEKVMANRGKKSTAH